MITVVRLFSSIVCMFVLFSNVAFAKEWTATKVFQPAQYSMDGKSWKNIIAGTVMPSASWIQTGKRGRLVLNRGKEMIQFKPNTMASISKANPSGSKTLVRHQFGSLLLDVETKNRKHLKVETPFLAAVVKGTRFTVDITESATRLSVQRGTVEVMDERRGEKMDVHIMQTVNVSKDAKHHMRVDGFGRKSKMVKFEPREPKMKSHSHKDMAGKFSNIFGPKKSFVANFRNQMQVQREKFLMQMNSAKSGNFGSANLLGRSAKSKVNSNAGGKGNSGKSNAGGNGKGNSGNSNAGGNGNSGNSNAGGNGNSGNSNAGGNGNSGNSNSGGNGNGNSGNSNSGGNGNGNSGNSNAGGNGNGKSK